MTQITEESVPGVNSELGTASEQKYRPYSGQGGDRGRKREEGVVFDRA
jgi:hypothetical protein